MVQSFKDSFINVDGPLSQHHLQVPSTASKAPSHHFAGKVKRGAPNPTRRIWGKGTQEAKVSPKLFNASVKPSWEAYSAQPNRRGIR